MIIVEQLNEMVERRHSDLGVKIKQVETDTLWNDAIDTIPCRFTYVETAQPIDDDDDATEDDLIEVLEELGVNV